MNIFYITTNPTDVQRLHDCLKEEEGINLKFNHADNLNTVKQILRGEKFDIIFLDPRLAGCIGLESLQYLKSAAPNTPIIIISGENNKKLGKNAISQGAEDYLMNDELDCKLVMKSIRYAIERKNANNRIRTTEDRLKKLVNTTPSVIYVTKIVPQHFCTYISDNFTSMMGYPKHKMVGSSSFWLSCVHPDDRAEAIAYINEKIKNHSYGSVEYRFRAQDGSYRWIHDNFNVSCNDEREPVEILGSWSDITTYKDATDEATRLLAAISSTDESIFITDTDGRILYVNPAFSRITGYSYAEVIGNNPSVLKSGNQNKKFYNKLWKTITRGDVFKATFSNKNKTGEEYYSEQTITPVKDETGKIIEYICVGRDITEQKKLDEQLRQAQKMEAIGQLTGGIAHDFNNRLTVILGNLQLLERRFGDDEAALKLLNSAIKATQGGATMTQRLLSFSRQQVFETDVIEINKVIHSMIDLLMNSLGETIDIKLNLEKDLWEVETDINQLEEALLNLCVNARDAMPNGGKIVIETLNTNISKKDTDNSPFHIEAGDYVKLSISDTGCGMPAKIIEKIYEPFFTTKESGKGTGLGMAMVYGFVKQSGGFIDVFSEKGSGARIDIHLPRKKQKLISKTLPEKQKNKLVRLKIPHRKNTVLIVEDDTFVRKISTMLLDELGFNVIQAEDGNSAIKILNANSDIKIVFSDMMMPGGMNGVEMIEKMRESRPEIKAIIVSGYSNENIVTKDMKITWIKKPFTRETLIEKFENILAEENRHVKEQAVSH